MSVCFHTLTKTASLRVRPGTISIIQSHVNLSRLNNYPNFHNNTVAVSPSSFSISTSIRSFSYADESSESKKDDNVVYEGPFASLALRLKRISISSAVLSVVGVPVVLTCGSNLPVSGQLAVGGTAMLAACGSTAALSFCFNPYIHKLEWIPVRQCHKDNDDDNDDDNDNGEEKSDERAAGDTDTSTDVDTNDKMLLKATTRNFFAMSVETVFDPDTDVEHDPKNYRPFCNFAAKGMPLFLHPHLVEDEELRIKLVGKEKASLLDEAAGKDDGKKKDPDDDFL